MKSIELKPVEFVEKEHKREEKEQEVPVWKFYRKDEPNEDADWYYCKCTKDIIVDVLTGFKMEVNGFDDNCIYVPNFNLSSCGTIKKMMIVRCDRVDTDDKIDYDIFVHDDCRLPLYSWDASRGIYYSNEW